MPDPRLLARLPRPPLRLRARRPGSHYTELADRLGLTPAAALQVQRDLASSGLRIWMHPHSDHIVAVSPLSDLPTRYRISVHRESSRSCC